MRFLLVLTAVGMLLLGAQCSLKVTSRMPPFSISIVEDSTTCRNPKSQFHVVVTNISNEHQRLCSDGCSWGYRALSFVFTDQAGKKGVACRTPQNFTRNIFGYRELHPREQKVFKIYEDDPMIWDGFPHPKNEPVTVTMQACLDYEPYAQDKDFLKRGVWARRVVSKPKNFTFYP